MNSWIPNRSDESTFFKTAPQWRNSQGRPYARIIYDFQGGHGDTKRRQKFFLASRRRETRPIRAIPRALALKCTRCTNDDQSKFTHKRRTIQEQEFHVCSPNLACGVIQDIAPRATPPSPTWAQPADSSTLHHAPDSWTSCTGSSMPAHPSRPRTPSTATATGSPTPPPGSPDVTEGTGQRPEALPPQHRFDFTHNIDRCRRGSRKRWSPSCNSCEPLILHSPSEGFILRKYPGKTPQSVAPDSNNRHT